MPATATATRTVTADSLRSLVAATFHKAGMPREDADFMSQCLVDADLRGVHSHGTRYVVTYIRALQKGNWNTTPNIKVVRDKGGPNGYGDRAAQLETDLRNLLRVQPLQSADGRLLFFNLTAYGDSLQASQTPQQWEANRERALYPLLFTWGKGFFPEETTDTSHWRWCGEPQGELHITNPGPVPRQASLRLSLAAAFPDRGSVRLDSPLLADTRAADPHGPLRLTIPPGKHTIRFVCTGTALRPANDPRSLYFRVLDFTANEPPPD